MYFEEDDYYYLYIEHYGGPTIYKLIRNYEWNVELIHGEDVDLGTLFSNFDIEEIVESLKHIYSIVELIDENEIDEYI